MTCSPKLTLWTFLVVFRARAIGGQTSSPSNAAVSGLTLAESLAQEWFTDNFNDNETQLAVGVNSALKNLTSKDMICNGSPSIQRRTDKMTPNGGCPAIFTSMNGSCSCLTTGYSDTNTFEFYVRLRGDEGMEYYPKSLDSSTILAIDSIRTLLVPSDLTTLKIVGEGMYPQTIKFVLQDRGVPGLTLPIAMVEDGTISLTTVSIENIDMSSVAQSVAAFYPSTTINITLRNCNLDQFGYNFFKGLNSVRYLDLSSNHLTAPYVGSSIAHTCSNQFCAVEVLNLTNNSIATFPTIVFNVDNLQELYIAKNAISDFNITSTVFRAIQALVAFDADLPSNAATCLDGSWHTAHNRNFCVLNMLDAKAKNSSLGHSKSLLIGLIGGGCVLAVIGITSIVWRCKKDQHLLLTKLDCFIQDCGDTRDDDDNRVQVNPVLLNDPVIITNRLEYKLIKMGQCVSTGGFGVVFRGVYRGRRVAIKKIRPDRSVTTAEVEMFLKEIILMAVLYHPRIVEFIRVAWDDLRHLSAVTEYMDNGDLCQVLHNYKLKGERLSWESHKATIALHIAEALSYLHSRRPTIVHRDLKSKNVLMNMHFEAKLSDFGISRMRYLVETHMTAGVGTAFWIAPEVLLGRDYDEAADIYSFGVVLSEIDTDEYPYWNNTNASNRGKIQEAEILSLVAEGTLRPQFSVDCPKAIQDLADCCLLQDPKTRPTADEIIDTLQHIKIQVGCRVSLGV